MKKEGRVDGGSRGVQKQGGRQKRGGHLAPERALPSHGVARAQHSGGRCRRRASLFLGRPLALLAAPCFFSSSTPSFFIVINTPPLSHTHTIASLTLQGGIGKAAPLHSPPQSSTQPVQSSNLSSPLLHTTHHHSSSFKVNELSRARSETRLIMKSLVQKRNEIGSFLIFGR